MEKRQAARTRKPCPACGEVNPCRARDKICSTCQQDLVELKKLRAAADNKKLKKKNRVSMLVEPVYYYWPYIPDVDHEISDSLRSCFVRLAMSIGEESVRVETFTPTDREYLVKPREASYDRKATYLFEVETAKLFRELFDHALKAIESAYTHGLNDVRSLFYNMVQGKVTLEQFAKKMQLEEQEITTRVIFSAAKPRTIGVRVQLCKAGMPDANGTMITLDRLDDIMKAYKDKGVPVERVNDEIWYEGSAPHPSEMSSVGALVGGKK